MCGWPLGFQEWGPAASFGLGWMMNDDVHTHIHPDPLINLSSASSALLPSIRTAAQVLQDGGFIDSFQVSWGSRRINPNLRDLGADRQEGLAMDSSGSDADTFQVRGDAASTLSSSLGTAFHVHADALIAPLIFEHQAPVVGMARQSCGVWHSINPADASCTDCDSHSAYSVACQPASRAPGCLQVKLEHPADIQGSVSLRGEEDGFFGHSVASCLQVWQHGLIEKRPNGDFAADERAIAAVQRSPWFSD